MSDDEDDLHANEIQTGKPASETPRMPPGEEAPEPMEWKASPSQLLNAPPFTGGVVLLVLCGVGVYYAGGIAAEGDEGLKPLLETICMWGLIIFALIVLVWLLLKSIKLKATTYHITDGHLELNTGLLSRHTEMLECYRIRDVETTRPLHLRLFGIGHIDLVTSDRSAPCLRLSGIKDPVGITRRLRNDVERCRLRARVMGLDTGDEVGGAME